MAGKKAMDGVEEAVSLFPQASAKAIQRLIRRAQEKDAKAARRSVEKATRSGVKGGRLGSRIGRAIGRELAKAVSQRGAPKREAASIRQKAPDTGGKPFHFAHSVVTKADTSAAPSSRAAKAGKAAGHMRYIERETAVEATRGGAARDGREAGEVLTEAALAVGGPGRDDGSWDRERAAGPTMGSAAAAQGYVENPVKLANGERVLFSFGTIGATFDERVHFWTALEEAETHPSARVQNRLIVELPHEATPEARHEIVRVFCRRFEADGVPYWAALHAPGKDNDSRNYHAHIVYSERPAKRVVDAADGREKWDFEVVRTHVKASRNRVQTRPERQNKLRAYASRRFIPDLRKDFAAISNGVLARGDVRDAQGSPVRYDHRSYKDMGVDAVPMRSINRIVADKMRDGKVTVLDGDYTRKMVAAELRQAAAQRDKQVLELIALDRALEDVTRDPAKATRHNKRLPREMRVSPLAQLSRATLRATSRRLMEARHGALRVDVMERSTTASLNRVIEATAPGAVAAAARARDPVLRAAAPDPAVAALLHEAAKEELAAMRAEAARARKTFAFRAASAMAAWKEAVAPLRTPPSPETRAAREEVARGRATPGIGRSGDAVATPQPTPGRDAAFTTTVAETAEATRQPAPSRVAASAAQASSAGRAPGGPGRASAVVSSATAGLAARRLEEEVARMAAAHAARLSEATERALAGGSLAPPTPPAHRRDRAPTVLEVLAASRGVSAFLRGVAKANPDVADRMRIIGAWAGDLARPRRAAAMSTGAETAAMLLAAPGPAVARAEGAAPTSPALKAPASAATGVSSVEAVAPVSDCPAVISTARSAARGDDIVQRDLWPRVPDAGPAAWPDLEGRRGQDPAGGTRGMVIGEAVEMPALGVGSVPMAGPTRPAPGPADARAPCVDAPAKEKSKKRRKTQEELEEDARRKKMRRAVLARKKRREIGR